MKPPFDSETLKWRKSAGSSSASAIGRRFAPAFSFSANDVGFSIDMKSPSTAILTSSADRHRSIRDQRHLAAAIGRALEMHGLQRVLHRGGGRARHRGRHRMLDRRAGEIVELEEVARVALGEVVEPDSDLVGAGNQRDLEFLLRLEIAPVRRHPAGLGAVDEQHRAAAGAQPERSLAGGRGGDDGLRPGAEHRRPEPEAGQVDAGGIEGQPCAVRREDADGLRPLAAALGGELGAAGIFVRDEVLVLGQEEEGVHLPLHRLVGDVVARFVRRSQPPIDDLPARGERPPQRVVRIDPGAQVHCSSATFTGATSL